jgi:flavin-dependent dehydrogenase
MEKSFDIIIIGGGLAGLTAALQLSKSNYKLLLIEKNTYPHHKVCGEYVSNEVLAYLNSLGIDPLAAGAKQIDSLQISNASGKQLQVKLPLGGFGISRYALDDLMFQQLKNKVPVIQDTVTSVDFVEDGFTVKTQSKKEFQAKYVIGAFGKRSNLDKSLNRKFFSNKTEWMAVKAHYKAPFPEDLVALHHFPGGYCGLSQVETGVVNLCYLTKIKAFSPFKNISEFEAQVLCQNPHLKTFLSKAEAVFEKPLTISQISFERKKTIENHLFMVGDSASLIHPLCGNGMAMAITAAKLLVDTLTELQGKPRADIENSYTQKWKTTFTNRLLYGSLLQKVMMQPMLLNLGLHLAKLKPDMVPRLISKTHGKTL